MSNPRGEPESPSVQYAAYRSAGHGRSHSESRQERAERESADKAMDEFRQSPAAQEIAALRAELADLKQWRTALQGQGGIRVTGTIIEFDAGGARVPKVGETSSPLVIKDEGTVKTNAASSLNFVGPTDGASFGFAATNSGDDVTVTLTVRKLTVRVCVAGAAYDMEIRDAVIPP